MILDVLWNLLHNLFLDLSNFLVDLFFLGLSGNIFLLGSQSLAFLDELVNYQELLVVFE